MRTIDRMEEQGDRRARPDTVTLIRAAGLELIHERGYEGMGLRGLAERAGIGQGTLYGHYATKQDLLVDLITRHMEALLASLRAEVPQTGPALDRFIAFVRFHLLYHIRRRREVFICYSELRSLEPGNYSRVVALRRDYERVLTGIIAAGVAEGSMRPTEPRVTTYAVLSMLSGITQWYRDDGPLPEAEVVAIHLRLAVAAVVDPLGAVIPPGSG